LYSFGGYAYGCTPFLAISEFYRGGSFDYSMTYAIHFMPPLLQKKKEEKKGEKDGPYQ